MKITNKKIIAAILIAATLTGCDSLKNKAKDGQEGAVEEQTVDEAASQKEGKEDAENTGSTEEADGEKDPAKDAESDAETEEGLTLKEQLEDSIFTNRVQARACEILLEEAPESLTEETKAKLQELMEESNQLIEEAEALIDTL